MRDPLSRQFSALTSGDSWLHRVRENLRQLFVPVRVFPSSANGALLHALKWERSPRSSRAQGASLLTHAAIICILALLALRPAIKKNRDDSQFSGPGSVLTAPPDLFKALRSLQPDAGSGSGSGHDTLPTRAGNLPMISSIQLLKPTLPQNPHPEVPVPPTILDASAPRVLTAVDNIGLPWAHEANNSSGRGKGDSIGDSPEGDSIGNTPGDGVGNGPTPGFYRPGMTWPKCAYCPDPAYTDEAREAKVQGSVTLQVLVGADGHAAQIRVLKGIGLGLDERAAEIIRTWKFVPARDAAQRPVPAWVTVETVFRLF
jgi:periplasmic protein TonB